MHSSSNASLMTGLVFFPWMAYL